MNYIYNTYNSRILSTFKESHIMSVKEKTTLSLDSQTKREGTVILDEMGLSLSTFMEMALRQLVRDRRLPFTPDLRRSFPKDSEGYPVFNANMNDPRIMTPRVRDGAVILPEGWDDDDDE